MAAALRPLDPRVAWEGTSDLALGGRKFSGNSLRCKRRYVMYHGTLLYDFALERVPRFLRPPPREPAYRGGRSHADFLTNLPVGRAAIERALLAAWQAHEALEDWPEAAVARLVAERYSQDAWNRGR
jgi:lipoate-protein ligase A